MTSIYGEREVWQFPLPGGKWSDYYIVAPGDVGAAITAGGRRGWAAGGTSVPTWSPNVTPPGTPPGTPPVPVGPVKGDFAEVVGPYAAYLQRYGLGKPGLGLYEDWQKSFARPLESLHDIQSLMSSLGEGNTKPNFENWLGAFGQSDSPLGVPAYSYGGDILKRLMSLTPEQRGAAGLEFGKYGRPGASIAEGIGLGDLGNVLYTALRPSIGTTGAGWIQRQVAKNQQDWLSQQVGELGKDTFLDYLKQRYGLGQYGF